MPRKRININSIYVIIRKRERTAFHFHNQCRHYDGFVLLTEGKGTFKLCNKDGSYEEFPIQKGSLILLKSCDKYYINTDSPCEYITSACDFGRRYYQHISELPRVMDLDEKLYGEIEEMSEIWQSRSWDSYIICKIKLLQLYLAIMRLNEDELSSEDPDIVMAVEFIHNNFKRNFTTEEIARVCALSTSCLRSKFFKRFGITITEYRDNLRISAAKEMLRSNEFTINDIAEILGYFDASHFSKFFTRKCGMTPSQFTHIK